MFAFEIMCATVIIFYQNCVLIYEMCVDWRTDGDLATNIIIPVLWIAKMITLAVHNLNFNMLVAKKDGKVYFIFSYSKNIFIAFWSIL
jgi:hypothetical protein